MKNIITKLLSVLLVGSFTVSCGDDAPKTPDAPNPQPDMTITPDMPNFPAAPALGAQIDRMGRPAINTALNHTFSEASTKGAAKDAYNAASDPAMWSATPIPGAPPLGGGANTVRTEFARNLAIIDALDTTCGNQTLYEQAPASPTSYLGMAGVLSDDQLYLDTSKGGCNFYLSLEVEVALGVAHTQCGGRTLTHDIADVSYSLLAAGLEGFDVPNGFIPQIRDGAVAHTDVSNDMFPFLGAPHTP